MNAAMAEIIAAIDREIAAPEAASLPDAEVARLTNAIVRLHAAKVERREARAPLLDLEGLTTSAVLDAACEMIRQVNVNMFDVAMWFAHSELPGGPP